MPALSAPDEAVAAAMEEAADTARRRSGYFAAARAQRRAADLSPDPDTRARRLLAAAEDLQLVGWTDSARELATWPDLAD